jgi:hypothetical protein
MSVVAADISVTGTIVLSGWWGKRSALFAEDSLLYRAKKLFSQRLIRAGLATDSDLDRRNLTPHVQLLMPADEAKTPVRAARFTENPNTEAQARFDRMNGQSITLTPASLLIHSDHVEVDTGDNTHVTMFFKRGLGEAKNHALIRKLWAETLAELAAQPRPDVA